MQRISDTINEVAQRGADILLHFGDKGHVLTVKPEAHVQFNALNALKGQSIDLMIGDNNVPEHALLGTDIRLASPAIALEYGI